MGYYHPSTQKFIEVMLQENSPYIGLVPDMGLFCKRFPRVVKECYLHKGANPALVEYMVQAYDNGDRIMFNTKIIPAELEKQFNLSAIDREFIINTGGFEYNDLSLLEQFMPYTRHIHGKFYEMLEDGEEYSIPYQEILDLFVKHGYNGFISSEYEGNRFIHDYAEVKSVEQVGFHQQMLTKYLGN
ncbi:hypothetical protein HUB94_13095 [Paenibacillus cellulosilyticus]|nr:hypothetical protein HUB94_13095 [Paenibacillus cellulosilyticus]